MARPRRFRRPCGTRCASHAGRTVLKATPLLGPRWALAVAVAAAAVGRAERPGDRVLGPPFHEQFFTGYQHYELRRIVPEGYTWETLARLAPSREAFERVIFHWGPFVELLAHDGELDASPGVRFVVSAGSWPEFLEKTRPTFTWNDGDLLWVDDSQPDAPRFVLNRAHLHVGPAGRAQWVLLDEESLPANGPHGPDSRRAVARLQAKRPAPYCDAGLTEHYATVIASHADHGTVFEVGWQSEMGTGSGHVATLRHIYLLRDTGGKWHLLGEGPGSGGGRSGMTGETWEVQPEVRWTTVAPGGPPELRFRAQMTEDHLSPDEANGSDPFWSSFVTYQDYGMTGPFPAKPRPVGRPYLLAGAAEDFEAIVERLSAWLPDRQAVDEPRDAVRRFWRAQLRRLNPDLPAGTFRPGTRISILTYGEVTDLLR